MSFVNSSQKQVTAIYREHTVYPLGICLGKAWDRSRASIGSSCQATVAVFCYCAKLARMSSFFILHMFKRWYWVNPFHGIWSVYMPVSISICWQYQSKLVIIWTICCADYLASEVVEMSRTISASIPSCLPLRVVQWSITFLTTILERDVLDTYND